MARLTTGTIIAGNLAWHSGNDGSGSGLDADTIRGQQPSALSVSSSSTAGSAAICSGNAASGNKLTAGMSITLIGKVAGTVTFDGTGNATIVSTCTACTGTCTGTCNTTCTGILKQMKEYIK